MVWRFVRFCASMCHSEKWVCRVVARSLRVGLGAWRVRSAALLLAQDTVCAPYRCRLDIYLLCAVVQACTQHLPVHIQLQAGVSCTVVPSIAYIADVRAVQAAVRARAALVGFGRVCRAQQGSRSAAAIRVCSTAAAQHFSTFVARICRVAPHPYTRACGTATSTLALERRGTATTPHFLLSGPTIIRLL
jgi:hypothetical protein